MDLENRVAIVTGSSRNIGRSIAVTLARAGAAVVVTTLKAKEAAEETAQEIRNNGGRAIVKLSDVREPARPRRWSLPPSRRSADSTFWSIMRPCGTRPISRPSRSKTTARFSLSRLMVPS